MVQMRGSRNFHQGGGEGPGQSDQKALITIFVVFSLFYRSQMVNFKEIYRFSRLQMRSNFFQGLQLFPGVSNCLFPIETHLICDFPEGVRTPCPPPPLWIRTWCSPHSFMVKATIHYLVWAWQTLIDRSMYHPFIVISYNKCLLYSIADNCTFYLIMCHILVDR